MCRRRRDFRWRTDGGAGRDAALPRRGVSGGRSAHRRRTKRLIVGKPGPFSCISVWILRKDHGRWRARMIIRYINMVNIKWPAYATLCIFIVTCAPHVTTTATHPFASRPVYTSTKPKAEKSRKVADLIPLGRLDHRLKTTRVAVPQVALDDDWGVTWRLSRCQARRDALDDLVEQAFVKEGDTIAVSLANWRDDTVQCRRVVVVGPAFWDGVRISAVHNNFDAREQPQATNKTYPSYRQY